MSLKELMRDYLQDENARDEFDKSPRASFANYQVTAQDQIDLLSRNIGDLRERHDDETMALLGRVHVQRPGFTLLYPDVDLKIDHVRPNKLKKGAGTRLNVELTWDHAEDPPEDLPPNGRVEIKYLGDRPWCKEFPARISFVDFRGRLKEAKGTTLPNLLTLEVELDDGLEFVGQYQLKAKVGSSSCTRPYTLSVEP